MSVLAHYVITFVRNKYSVSYLYSFVNLSFTKDFKVVLSCIFLSREEAAVRNDPNSLCDNICGQKIFS